MYGSGDKTLGARKRECDAAVNTTIDGWNDMLDGCCDQRSCNCLYRTTVK